MRLFEFPKQFNKDVINRLKAKPNGIQINFYKNLCRRTIYNNGIC